MIEIGLVVVPLLLAAVAFAWRSPRGRPWLLPLGGAIHTLLVLVLVMRPAHTPLNAWFGFDAVARAVLPMVSVLFLICSIYAVAYLRIRTENSNRVFVAMLLSLHALLTLALQARHLGLLWIGAEAATLLTVPLLHFNNTARAIEATWKYLIVSGTGIALSLLGSFCLGYASLHGGGSGDLTFAGLVGQGPALSRPWLVAAWVLVLAGYGTKMGLAPMHTWKPDAYGEAPGVVGALLAGGTTTMAFVAVLRVKQVVDSAGAGAMTERTLLAIGLFSMAVAALFLLGTRDFKRMLAYSSVEQMGILAVGAALGTAGLAAAFFHVWNNALTKGALFLSAGNIRRAARASTVDEVSGMAWCAPVSARLLVVGVFAITAFPPFGPFFSELRIVRAGLAGGQDPIIAVFVVCLLMAFLGLSRLTFAVVDGRPRKVARDACRAGGGETRGVVIPPLAFLAISLLLGLATPSFLTRSWQAAAAFLHSVR
jgi:hydrogenase-4 component F